MLSKESYKSQPIGWGLPANARLNHVSDGQTPYPLQPGYQYATGPMILNSGYAESSNYAVSGHAIPAVTITGPAQLNNSIDVEDPKGEPFPNNFGESFSSRAIRHSFVRKVYTIVTLQLIVTLLFVIVFTLHDDVRRFVQKNTWVYHISYAFFLITYFTLICCTGVRRKWPGNLIMLSIFTLSLSYILGTLSAFYNTDIVLLSIGITALVCFLITLFAMQTKIDFTGCGIYLFIASVILLVFGIIAIIMRDNLMHLVYSGGITLLFSMYLIFDTQRIMGGKKHELSEEEHIFGALVLYIDVVMIFLGILGLSRSG